MLGYSVPESISKAIIKGDLSKLVDEAIKLGIPHKRAAALVQALPAGSKGTAFPELTIANLDDLEKYLSPILHAIGFDARGQGSFHHIISNCHRR